MSNGVRTQSFRLLMLRDATKAVAKQAYTGIFASLVNSLLLTGLWWPTHASKTAMLSWTSAVWLLSLLRIWWLINKPAKQAHTETELHNWLLQFAIGMTAAGVLWGLAAFVYFQPESLVRQLTLFMVLAGMIAGATTAFSALPLVSLTFVIPVSLLWIARLLGDMSVSGLWLGALVTVFSAFMVSMIFRSRRIASQLIHSRWRNRKLLGHIRAAKEQGLRLSDQVAVAAERTRNMEAELYEKDTLLQTVVNQVPVSVILTDLELTILYVYGKKSPVLLQQFGHLRGHSINQVFAAHAPVVRASTHALAGSQSTAMAEFAQHQFEFVAAPFRGADEVMAGVLIVAMDVSEEMRLRNLQEEFVSNVNHQLRTPLTSVLGSLELLAVEDQLDQVKNGRRLVEVALRNALRMKELVEQIARLEQAQQEQPPSSLMEVELVDLAQRVFGALPNSASHALDVDGSTGQAPLQLNAEILDAVLTCLFKNALEYSSPKSAVTLSLSVQGQPPEQLQIGITNSGTPIEARLRQRLFDKFQVGDFSDARRSYGMGLGLYLAKSMVESAGGRIWLERSDESGTQFCFSLPLDQSADAGDNEGIVEEA